MPSVSEKQRRFMAAAAHNPAFAKEVGIPQSVAREFHAADAGKSYGASPHIEARKKIAAALIKR